MRCINLAILTIGTPTLIWAGDNDADKAKLQGTWVSVAHVDKERAEPADVVGRLKLIIKDDTYTYSFEGKGKFSATFKLDSAKKPKWIDVDFKEGPAKGKSMPALFSLDGDELKICGGDKRPTELKASKDAVFFTFKRESK